MLKQELLISIPLSDAVRKCSGATIHPRGIENSKTADRFY